MAAEAALGALCVGLAWVHPLAVVPAVLAMVALPVSSWRRGAERSLGLQVEQIDRLRRAEVALAAAESTETAARELCDHAMALLGASSAVVLIEGPDDTIRVTAGEADERLGSVYADGSRMRLLEVDGVPVGSIAVGARTDGAPYTERDERILDALGQGVSSALHRLALFEEVRAERQTLADVLGSSSDGIFSAGPEHRIRSWNPAMERITGIPAGKALDEACCSVFRPFDADGTPLFGVACPGRMGRPTENLAVRLTDLDGEERWLTCTWSTMSDGGYVVVARDVTAQKKVEDAKADFLANISHELRTPLTPIQGFLDTLLRQDARFGDDERRRIYQLMLQQSHRMERLVKDLLEATTLDDTIGFLLPEAVDWGEAVERVVDQFRRQDPSRELEVVVRRGVPRVVADPARAEQVLANLLSNACKFTPPGSPVEVLVERRGQSVVTTVTDHGPGIPPSDRERVFERFTRLGDHLTRPEGGAGLGLYVARRLVEAMGGRIAAEGGADGGAVLRFSLPVHSRRAPARAVRRPVSAEARRGD